jgi:hypothetical protein
MRQLIFDCSICAKLYGDGRKLHLLSKGAELTLNEWFSQCSGCGAFAVKIVDEALVKEL